MSDRLQMDPMTGEELKAYIAYSRGAYVDDRVTHGGEDRLDAEEVAARQYAEEFKDGEPAEGHFLFTGRDATTGERVGVLWLFERATAAGTSVFVYDVEVEEELRGQGWGRELMAYGEQWARGRGAHEIALNVFGGNARARGLYTSLGYSERAVTMSKPLRSLKERAAVGEMNADGVHDHNLTLDAVDDDWEWRRKIRSNPHSHVIYRVVVGVVGLMIVVLGLIMVPFPGPGWLVVFLGLAIWASEFEWAQGVLRFARSTLHAWTTWARSQPWWMKGLMTLATLGVVAAAIWLVLLISDISSFLPEWVVDLVVKLPGL